jgi:Fe-S-cluster containining protein
MFPELPERYASPLKRARDAAKENRKFIDRLKKSPPKRLDETVHQLHEAAFKTINCLECANCCKTTSPIFYEKDIERIARHLRMKPGKFIEQYLQIDEDNDYVLKSSPCVFLAPDNTCCIYENRPNACREYPHTDRKRIHQILDLTYHNTLVCPAVGEIVEKLKQVR